LIEATLLEEVIRLRAQMAVLADDEIRREARYLDRRLAARGDSSEVDSKIEVSRFIDAERDERRADQELTRLLAHQMRLDDQFDTEKLRWIHKRRG